MNKERIFIRADGNRTIGLGHISRCLALAELLTEDFEIVFATCEADDYILSELKKVSHKVICLTGHTDSVSFNNELNSYLTGTEIVVLDGYSFRTEYEKIVKKNSAAVISIDDIPNRHFVADGIINFCGAIHSNNYSKEAYTQVYLGFEYLFLRSPFLRRPLTKENESEMLLLNMGGGDSGNQTEKILKEILASEFAGRIVVVVGQSFQFSNSLESLIKHHSDVTLRRGLTAQEMYDTMSKCTMAILPPSTVALEFLSTGGTLFVNQTADNQQCMKKYLFEKNLAHDYSEFAESMVAKVRDKQNILRPEVTGTFDGSSLKRVKNLFASLGLSVKMNFRKATADDTELTYSWAIDPEARKYSYSKSEILWQDHTEWFRKKISQGHCEYFIVEIDSNPVGQIRFDLSEEEHDVYVISYLINEKWRGKGLGAFLLNKGIQKLIEKRAVKKIIGYVQNSNVASIKAFSRANFKNIADLKYPDSSKFELSFKEHEYH